MDYHTVSRAVLTPIFSHVRDNWVNSDQANFCEKQILARGACLGLAPLSFVTHAIDTVIGVGSGTVVLLTGGTHEDITIFASNHLRASKRLLASPYANLLLTLNPKASFGSGDEGFVANFVIHSLKEIAKDCRGSDNLLISHVASRLSYAVLAISSLVARAVDGVIGVIAALFSFLTVGKFEPLNDFAVKGLYAPGIINDLFCCAVRVINPWEGNMSFGS